MSRGDFRTRSIGSPSNLCPKISDAYSNSASRTRRPCCLGSTATCHRPALTRNRRPSRFDQQRDRVSVTVSRILRDRVFRRVVLRAYDERCAVTGLRFINGSGRAEVAAAHIRPVEASGPDIVGNGIALSGTAHWMFDRGLISLADDLEILISRQTNDPQGVRSIINKSGRALCSAPYIGSSTSAFLKMASRTLFQAIVRRVD